MDYYSRKIYIPQVNQNDEVVGAIERFEAHEKGILHRAFTVGLFVEDKILLQHRRHPVFDGVFDLTCSSHPTMEGNAPQDLEKAVYETLEREWGLHSSKLSQPKNKGSVLYSAKDELSIYKEHEVCHLYIAHTKQIPQINYQFSYGFSLLSRSQIANSKFPITSALAPWVTKLIPLLGR